MNINFGKILDRPLVDIGPRRSKKRKKRQVAQAQKYALVPQWRRPRGGKKGPMK